MHSSYQKLQCWLVCWTLDRVVRVRALARALRCVLGQALTLIVPLFTLAYKWVLVN